MRNAVCLALIQFVSSAFACAERLQLQIVKLPLSNWLQNGRGNTEAAVQQLITYRAKLLNADWFRQRAFFLNFPSMEGKITRF